VTALKPNTFLAISVAALTCVMAAPTLQAARLDDVLARMDKAGASFRDVSAKIVRKDHTAIINDTSEETGTIRMQKAGDRNVRMKIDFDEPDVRSVAFADRKAQIYYPKIRTVQVYDLGKYRDLVDQFLLLGFGTSTLELRKNYSVRFIGDDKVAGERTARLELTPKSNAAREHLSKVELWISDAGYPLQQKFYRPSGDNTLTIYSELKINSNLTEDSLKLRLPSGVKREYPQK